MEFHIKIKNDILQKFINLNDNTICFEIKIDIFNNLQNYFENININPIYFEILSDNIEDSLKLLIIYNIKKFLSKKESMSLDLKIKIINNSLLLINSNSLSFKVNLKFACILKILVNNIILDKFFDMFLENTVNKINNNWLSSLIIINNIFNNDSYCILIEKKSEIIKIWNNINNLVKKNYENLLNNYEFILTINIYLEFWSNILIYLNKNHNFYLINIINQTKIWDILFIILLKNVNNNNYEIIIMSNDINYNIIFEIINSKKFILKIFYNLDLSDYLYNYLTKRIIIELKYYFMNNSNDFNNKLWSNKMIKFLCRTIENNKSIEIFENNINEIIIFILLPNLCITHKDIKELYDEPKIFFNNYLQDLSETNNKIIKIFRLLSNKLDNFNSIINKLIENILNYLLNDIKKFINELDNITQTNYFSNISKENYCFLIYYLLSLIFKNYDNKEELIQSNLELNYNLFLKIKYNFNEIIITGFSIYLFTYLDLFFEKLELNNILFEYFKFLWYKIKQNEYKLIYLVNTEIILEKLFCDLDKNINNLFFEKTINYFFKEIVSLFLISENNNIIYTNIIIILLDNLIIFDSIVDEINLLINFISTYFIENKINLNQFILNLVDILVSLSSKKIVYKNDLRFEIQINDIFLVYKEFLDNSIFKINEIFINIINNTNECSDTIFLIWRENINYLTNVSKTIKKNKLIYSLIFLITKFENYRINENLDILQIIKKLSIFESNININSLFFTLIYIENLNHYLINKELMILLMDKINLSQYEILETSYWKLYCLIFFNIIIYKFNEITNLLDSNKFNNIIDCITQIIKINIINDVLIIRYYIICILVVFSKDNFKRINNKNYISLFKNLLLSFKFINNIKNNQSEDYFTPYLGISNNEQYNVISEIISNYSYTKDFDELELLRNYTIDLKTNNNYKFWIENLDELEINYFNFLLNNYKKKIYIKDEDRFVNRRIIKLKS